MIRNIQWFALTAFATLLLLCSGMLNAFAETAKKTYRNPLIADHNLADPHVIRVDNKFYLYESEHGTGCEVYVSDDLVHWKLQDKQAFVDPRGGVWAPDVFHDKRGDGKFYLYYTDNPELALRDLKRKQIGVAVADDPLGPFIDKTVLVSSAIDAHMFQDEDGKYYLYYVDRSADLFLIMVQPMADPVTKKGEPKEVLRPTEPWEKTTQEITEGPFMLKTNGICYLMYSGSGTKGNHYAIGYATSKSPLGPFKKYEGNPIARGTDKIISPGHHSVVTGPDNKLWLVYHQKRTREINFNRFMAIDPLWFDDKGVIHVKLSRDTDEPAP